MKRIRLSLDAHISGANFFLYWANVTINNMFIPIRTISVQYLKKVNKLTEQGTVA